LESTLGQDAIGWPHTSKGATPNLLSYWGQAADRKTTCSQSQIGQGRHLRRQGAAQVEVALALSVAVRSGPLLMARQWHGQREHDSPTPGGDGSSLAGGSGPSSVTGNLAGKSPQARGSMKVAVARVTVGVVSRMTAR
jgi:hypothetical protein